MSASARAADPTAVIPWGSRTTKEDRGTTTPAARPQR
jgi:hypothetical protein